MRIPLLRRMALALTLFATATLGFGSEKAHAYGISTHLLITRRAVEEYRLCRKWTKSPELSKYNGELLGQANTQEDYNILTKSFNWHFYRPGLNLGHAVIAWGQASLKKRFIQLQSKISKTPSIKLLGTLSHYAQDVTNPAHVVPVFHWLSDTFDNYDFEKALPPLITETECRLLFDQAKHPKTYFQLLDAVSIETLERLKEEFSYSENGSEKKLRWDEGFWQESHTSKPFGSYGRFGNKYGTTQLGEIHIDPEVYVKFSQRQLRSAINVTLIYLYRYFRTSRKE